MKTPLLSPWTQCAEGGHQVLRQDALGFPYLGLFPGLAVLPADNIHSPFALSWDFCMRKWAPCHSVVAAPLLIAFKLLLCIYLESIRGRFSMPAPSLRHVRHWAPCHSVVAAPLLIAFKLLLCIYLESIRGGLLRRSALYSSPFY
ncbi:hypothetical protein EJB05_50176 [Eragrostis curvula]|uniref:Uncharacterized protein n=1 Tax=Eragrostis curvula TaxID=38414 RepID=A0A5J9SYU4_9POAL|nr:hypothetical protein EJB05_50176 [Eragrostis curvula]